MHSIHIFDEIQQLYSEFIEQKTCPKLESLNNWAKNRFFFQQYFRLIEDWHYTKQVVVQFNQQYFSLDLDSAPDFMDKDKYLAWLREELVC